MLIAVSQKQEKNAYGENIDTLEQAYIQYVQQFGIYVLIVPNILPHVQLYLDSFSIDGIIITGGNEVDPLSYSGTRAEGIILVPERDRTERALIEYAIKKKLPLLGICRGMQFMNVYFGGKLINIKQTLGDIHPPRKDHSLDIIDFPLLGNKAQVNSYHNYGLTKKELSPQLKAFALCGELVEGIYHPTLPMVGIIWHPERKSPDEKFNEKVMNAFVKKELLWKKGYN